ncbi:hypothetical protein DL768_008725 [Monosporascus sp. mg162]|nr:hypothetical protein DL768_008725 [Monosporascus sp. mg162]
MFAPAMPQVSRSSTYAAQSSGWIMGPLVLAPVSEFRGRLAVYAWSSALYLGFTATCALAPGAAPLTLGGGTISDLIPVREWGQVLLLYRVGPILGPPVGPLAGG